MIGETHDVTYPNDTPIADTTATQSSHVLEVAIVWIGIYFLIIVPCNLMPISKSALEAYDDGVLKPRVNYFRNFRQYENIQ